VDAIQPLATSEGPNQLPLAFQPDLVETGLAAAPAISPAMHGGAQDRSANACQKVGAVTPVRQQSVLRKDFYLTSVRMNMPSALFRFSRVHV
jgi:hypothetical protein